MNSNLVPFQGTWDRYKAAHLLRRTLFGVKLEEIRQAEELGLEATVERLLQIPPLPDPPLIYSDSPDPYINVGSTWHDKGFETSMGLRENSLNSWMQSLMMENNYSIREKMVLFWHNHFGIRMVGDARWNYLNNDLVRRYCLGDFHALMKEMTIDGSMLAALDGGSNTRFNPNENFARELLELFTVGKGPQVAVGDYTTYTDHDIIELAKVFSGWRVVQRDTHLDKFFQPDKHNITTKKLSHRFNEVEITNQGEDEYKTAIDIIFSQKGQDICRFMCTKFYRWFVHHEVTPEVEVNVIEPLATIMLENNFVVAPVIKALLTSDQMYSDEVIGCIVKSPIEFTLGTVRALEIQNEDSNFEQDYFFWHLSLNKANIRMQMELYQSPSVAGWKAYYSVPAFSKVWLNSVTVIERMDFINRAIAGFDIMGITHKIKPLQLLEKVSIPSDIEVLIDEFALLLYSYPLSNADKAKLKELLIPGLPDFEWTVEYGEYLADPSKESLIEEKIRSLISHMLKSPEYLIS